MATKKSSKSSKTKTIKTAKPTVDHNHVGKCFVAFGLIITILLFGFFYLLGQRKTYMEKQELLAFRGVVDRMLYEEFEIKGERVASIVGDLGMTKDNDLYADFVIQKYLDHVPQSYQKARIHFQCHEKDSLKLKDNCSHAYWYGEEIETSAEFREKYATYLNETNRLIDEINATPEEDKSTRDSIRKQLEKLNEEYKPFFEQYNTLLQQ